MTDVVLCEVGPRDGLQNEPRILPPSVRADLCRRLAAAGLPRVEVASFVHPRHVPTMVGAEDVVAALSDEADWMGLVLNARGYERARDCGVTHVDYVIAATDTFSQRNQGCTVDEAVATGLELADRARRDSVAFTMTVAVAFGCPFDGPVDPDRVLALVDRIAAAPHQTIVLADTIGVAVPTQVRHLVRALATRGVRCGGHFHDTRNTGIANALAALEAGAGVLDASIGGSGGCPFAPGATGNVATEDLVYVLERMGVHTGVDLDAVIACTRWLAERLGHDLPGALTRAGLPPAGDETRPAITDTSPTTSRGAPA